MAEKIIAVAMKTDRLIFHMPSPNRHHHIFGELIRCGVGRINVTETLGFMTSTGRFVDRVEARKVAEAAGQILAEKRNGIPFKRIHNELYSEDLW